jgi:phenylacetate-coenzyme A ligase PaaK-like adenylate-forming protein
MAAFDDWIADPAVNRAIVDDILASATGKGVAYRDGLFVCTSSGTTGRPGIFVHDRSAVDVYRVLNAMRLTLGWLGAREWLKLGRRGIRWAAVMAAGGPYIGSGWLELERRRSAWKARAYRVFPVESPLGELVRDLGVFDPTILSGYPSALELLAEAQLAGRLHLRPVLIESAGESMTEAARARIEAAFGVPVHVAYGTSEFLALGFSCPQGWIHVNSDWAILEPVDEGYRPTPPGQPSYTVLLTNLANRIQPIIRYDLGDSVTVRPDRCPCGSPLQAIRVAGRSDDILRLVAAEGRCVAIPPLAIGSVLDEVPGIQRSQLVQTGPSTLRVRWRWRRAVIAIGSGKRQPPLYAGSSTATGWEASRWFEPRKRRNTAPEAANSARSSGQSSLRPVSWRLCGCRSVGGCIGYSDLSSSPRRKRLITAERARSSAAALTS